MLFSPLNWDVSCFHCCQLQVSYVLYGVHASEVHDKEIEDHFNRSRGFFLNEKAFKDLLSKVSVRFSMHNGTGVMSIMELKRLAVQAARK